MPIEQSQIPAEAAAPQGEGAKEQRSAQQLVVDINDAMGQLMSKMEGKSDPEDIQQIQALQQGFQSFVDGMGAPKGGVKGGVAPAEAGAANVKPMM